MISAHTAVAIAQLVLYLPMVPLAIALFRRNGKIRPRMAWWPLIPFCLLRLVGAIITIIAQQKAHAHADPVSRTGRHTDASNTGLDIAASIILNVGVVPLLVANLGLVRLIIMDNHTNNSNYDKVMKALRIVFVVAIICLVISGSVVTVSYRASHILGLAGYSLFIVVLASLLALEFKLYHNSRCCTMVSPCSRRILYAALAVYPLLDIRIVYGMLQVVGTGHGDNVWSPLFGSAVAFALMALLPEYIILCVWVAVGFSIPPLRDGDNVGNPEQVELGKK